MITFTFSCETLSQCKDIGLTSNCGWWPSLKRGFIGTFYGLNDGISCHTTDETNGPTKLMIVIA